MNPAVNPASAATVPAWVWLFPFTAVAHIAEEYWAGQGFPAWISQYAETPLTENLFLILTAAGLFGMTVCVLIARLEPGATGLLIALATIQLVNGIAHLGASLWTASYSPGVFTGLLLWVPLGMFGLTRLRSLAGSGYLPGIIGGLLFHAALSATILFRG